MTADQPVAATANMIPVGILGRMRHVLTSDEAIWWWWTHPIQKLRGRTPRESHEAGDHDEVRAVVDGYLSRDMEAFS